MLFAMSCMRPQPWSLMFWLGDGPRSPELIADTYVPATVQHILCGTGGEAAEGGTLPTRGRSI
jgi:hypothetical protein